MTEEQAPQFLSVARLIEDLSKLDQAMEVAVVMHGGGMTVPINHLMKIDTPERSLALLIINEENVRRALDANANMQAVN